MHIECMVMHDVQNESLVFLYQLGTLSPLPSGEKEVSQTPHWQGKNKHNIFFFCFSAAKCLVGIVIFFYI